MSNKPIVAPKGCKLPMPGTGEYRELELKLAKAQGLTTLPKEQAHQLRQLARKQLPRKAQGKSRVRSTYQDDPFPWKKIHKLRASGSGKPVDRDGKRRK